MIRGTEPFVARFMKRRFALGAVVVICLIFAIPVFLGEFSSDDPRLEWYTTVGGALLGAGIAAYFAVEFFDYQLSVQDDKRSEELLKALIAELYATRDRMKTSSTEIVPDPTGAEPDVSVVVTHLEPTACEEAIRNALLNPHSARSLTYLSRVIREYTKTADLLRSTLFMFPVYEPPVTQIRAYKLAKSVKAQQLFVIHWCDTVLDGLKEQGAEMPADEPYYSDPNKEAPKDFFRYD